MPSPQTVYEHLQHLEDVDTACSAVYREEAYEAITDPGVDINWQQKICDCLYSANLRLALRTVTPEDSY